MGSLEELEIESHGGKWMIVLEMLRDIVKEKRHRAAFAEGVAFVATCVMIGGLTAGIGSSIYHAFTPKESPTTLEQELEKLRQAEKSLTSLEQFVAEQRKAAIEVQEVVDQLASEQKKLEPVVEADRATVDAVLRAHSDSQKADVWKERGIGFVLGILSSFIVSPYWISWSKYWWVNWKLWRERRATFIEPDDLKNIPSSSTKAEQ